MVIDASALVAIVLDEPEARRLREAIIADPIRLLGAPTYVEAALVLANRRGLGTGYTLDGILDALNVRVVPMTAQAARLGHLAILKYGKGVGTPGVLNFGDCLAYGVATALGEPLLFKGDDFARTDVAAAPY